MSEKKVNAKFTRVDNTDVTIKGIEEQEIIDSAGDLRANGGPADDTVINIGRVKQIDIVNNEGESIQTAYGDKNNS